MHRAHTLKVKLKSLAAQAETQFGQPLINFAPVGGNGHSGPPSAYLALLLQHHAALVQVFPRAVGGRTDARPFVFSLMWLGGAAPEKKNSN